jgi:uncharacterized protein (DUF1697 family)
MPVYIALLRGINVGAHKRMKMDKLRTSCESLGFKNVKTLIQSRNVVFQAAKMPSASVSKKIEQRIVTDFGFAVDVISRSQEEMSRIISSNPFAAQSGLDAAKLHVVFLEDVPTPESVEKLKALTLAPDKVHVASKEIYFYFPNGVSGSSLWKHPLDRVLGMACTMRNWNTVNKLHEMASECG